MNCQYLCIFCNCFSKITIHIIIFIVRIIIRFCTDLHVFSHIDVCMKGTTIMCQLPIVIAMLCNKTPQTLATYINSYLLLIHAGWLVKLICQPWLDWLMTCRIWFSEDRSNLTLAGIISGGNSVPPFVSLLQKSWTRRVLLLIAERKLWKSLIA